MCEAALSKLQEKAGILARNSHTFVASDWTPIRPSASWAIDSEPIRARGIIIIIICSIPTIPLLNLGSINILSVFLMRFIMLLVVVIVVCLF